MEIVIFTLFLGGSALIGSGAVTHWRTLIVSAEPPVAPSQLPAPSCMYRVDIMHRLVFSPTVPDHHHHHTAEHCNLCLLFVLLCPPRGCITPCYICRHAAHMQHVNITDTRVKTTTVLQARVQARWETWEGSSQPVRQR